MIRVGQVGLGWFGSIHLQTWQGVRGAAVTGVCDVDPSRFTFDDSSLAQDKFHSGHVNSLRELPSGVDEYHDLDDLLASGIDLLDVVTTEGSHAECVRRGLERGIDVVVEKPLALSHSEARELVELARTNGCNLYVGHVLRFDPRNVCLAETLDRAALRHMSFQRNFQTAAHDVYGRVHPVHSAVVHDLDLALWYAGRPPAQVHTYESSFLQRETPDVVDIVLEWDDGLRAIVQNSWHLAPSCPYGFEFEAKVQTLGTTFVIRNEPDLQVWGPDSAHVPELHFWPYLGGARHGALRSELQHFADCCEAGAPSDRVPLEQVLWLTDLCTIVATSSGQRS